MLLLLLRLLLPLLLVVVPGIDTDTTYGSSSVNRLFGCSHHRIDTTAFNRYSATHRRCAQADEIIYMPKKKKKAKSRRCEDGWQTGEMAHRWQSGRSRIVTECTWWHLTKKRQALTHILNLSFCSFLAPFGAWVNQFITIETSQTAAAAIPATAGDRPAVFNFPSCN